MMQSNNVPAGLNTLLARPILEVESVSKRFPGVLALSEVSVSIEPGEVHCWIGENGAGKSTLIKILAGGQLSDQGTIKIAGQTVSIASPHIAQKFGLSFIFQELNVVSGLSVADNIFLGNELSNGPVVRKAFSESKAREILERIGFGYLDPATKVGKLTTAEKQAVMVGRALSIDAKIIFMDETTATLDKDEVDRIFKVIQAIKAEGRSVVFVSHRLNEISAIADRITVFKDGSIVGTYLSKDLPIKSMIRLMVGRDIANIFPIKERQIGGTILEASNLATKNIRNVNLRISAGKVTGIAGLVGSGRTELLNALFGLDSVTHGSISYKGNLVNFRNCRDAIRLGIGMVPEDRRGQGIIALRSVEENISITWALRSPGRNWRVKSKELAEGFVSTLGIRTPNIQKQIGLLSGGNQQKCILARWLSVSPNVLLLDEPTRGIDVGAKSEIYQIVDRLARNGMGVVIVSSDLIELLGLADEIAVMREGNFMGILPGNSTEEEVMTLAMKNLL